MKPIKNIDMKIVLIALSFILFSCSKQNPIECDLAGTWVQEIKSDSGQVAKGFTLILNADGTMQYEANNDYTWRGDCTSLEFVFKYNKGVYTKLEILSFDGNTMILEYSNKNIATSPFEYHEKLELHKIK